MFFKRSGAQGPGTPLDSENRALLIVIGLLSLLIFMDKQAGRQIDLRAEKILKSDLNEIIEDGRSDVTERLDSAAESADDRRKQVQRELLENRIEPVKKKADDLIRKGIDEGLEQADEANSAIQKQIEKASSYKQLGELRPVTGGGEQAVGVELYFIRFRSGKSEIVKVSRTVPATTTIRDMIALLQAGPGERETGLLNAFDESVKVHSIALTDGILRIDVDDGIHRMGQSIIRDRMHQLLFTVFQFKNIEAVQLLVNGKRTDTIGRGDEAVGVPELLGKPGREVVSY